jgi:hypothetical protein
MFFELQRKKKETQNEEPSRRPFTSMRATKWLKGQIINERFFIGC